MPEGFPSRHIVRNSVSLQRIRIGLHLIPFPYQNHNVSILHIFDPVQSGIRCDTSGNMGRSDITRDQFGLQSGHHCPVVVWHPPCGQLNDLTAHGTVFGCRNKILIDRLIRPDIAVEKRRQCLIIP